MTETLTPRRRLERRIGVALALAMYAGMLPAMWLTGHTSGLLEGRRAGQVEVLDAVTKQADERSRAEAAEAEKYTSPDPPQLIERGGRVTRGAAPFDWQPPQQFQGAALVAVYFTTLDDVRRQCGKDAGGCAMHDGKRHPLLIVRSPCLFYDRYALELCHEIGHTQGWPADHRDGHFVGEDKVDWTNGVLGDDGKWRVLACNHVIRGCEVEAPSRHRALTSNLDAMLATLSTPAILPSKEPNP